ncbi:MAG: hypothetical protein D6736_04145 [Nitrospinota bacterium]|nr:MAG: hypothetical protein D6736_04145 [Nitrospinota bacterium]
MVVVLVLSVILAPFPSAWASGSITLSQEAGVFSATLVEAEFNQVLKEIERLTGAEVVVVGTIDGTMKASTEFRDTELWRGIKRLFEAYHLKGVLIVGSETQIQKIYLTAQEGEASEASSPPVPSPFSPAVEQPAEEEEAFRQVLDTLKLDEEEFKSALEEAIKKHLSQGTASPQR